MAVIHWRDRGLAAAQGKGHLLVDALPGILLGALLLALIAFFRHPEILRGDLVDPDSYMHIVRLRGVLADGWHRGFFPRDNAPFGMVLHWSKAYDLVFLAVAAPFAAVAGWSAGFAIATRLIGPLSIAALLLAAMWAARPLLDATTRRFGGLLIALAPLVLNYGMIGNVTYHVPVVAAWTLFLGFALRLATAASGPRLGVTTGLAASFALWLTVECILGIALGVALMGLAWIRDGRSRRGANLGFAAAFFLSTALLLAVDPPYKGWLYPEAERLSILYVAFAGLLALLWVGIAAAPQNPEAWRIRLAVALAGAVLAAGSLFAAFPGVLAPEKAVFGTEVGIGFWNQVAEMQPAFREPSRGVLWLGAPLLGLVAAIAFAWRERRPAARWGWGFFAAMLGLLIGPGLLHARFAIYPEVLAALPVACAMRRVEPFMERWAPTAIRLAARVLGIVLIAIGPMLAAGALSAAMGRSSKPAPAAANCAVRGVADALNDPAFMGGSDLIILTHPDQAPETLYWTGHRVVAGLYHLNVEGLHDALSFMASRDDDSARRILARRGVAYVMVCGGGRAAREPAKPDEALYKRLQRGAAPSWLTPQPWPAGISSDLRLFRVRAAAGR